jgi:hypothetical protein
MNWGWGIVLGALLIGAAIALSHRYEIAATALGQDYVSLWRVDNWTGEILYCDHGDSGEACEVARVTGR